MDFEASTSSSPPPVTDEKKSAARKRTRHPLYRGVRRRSSGKWVSEVHDPNKKSRIWLGTFPNPEMAAAAYDAAALALHGTAAKLNFTESAHRLPQPRSAAHADIQSAALHAARGDSVSMHVENNNNDTVVLGEAAAAEEFVDEEAMFNMPLLVDFMAEGMLLTPPAMKKGFSWAHYDDNDDYFDLTLWSD